MASRPENTARGAFASGFWECLGDEAVCWWTTWCCPLVTARTWTQFKLAGELPSGSRVTNGMIWLSVIVLSWIIISPVLALLVTAIWAVVNVVLRCRRRTQIREMLGISGSQAMDAVLHCCCSCCSICQEAREAKAAGLKMRDLVSGEVIDESISSQPKATTFNTDLSKSSSLILKATAFLALMVLLGLIAIGDVSDAFCFLLVFLQPAAIMFILIRKSIGAAAAMDGSESSPSVPPLDLLVKLFFVGFFVTTFQASVIEGFITGASRAVLLTLTVAESVLKPPMERQQQQQQQQQQHWQWLNPQTGFLRRFVADATTHLLLGSSPGVPNPMDTLFAPPQDASSSASPYIEMQRGAMRSHFFPIVVSIAFFCFLVAAGVEETVKHFIVRCCDMPKNMLSDPFRVLICLVVGALGFESCENLLFIADITTPVLPHTSVFASKLLVLFIRGVLPIHALCATLQAVDLSYVLGGERNYSLMRVLLPAILLHGTYDFNLLLFSNLQYIYPNSKAAVSFVVLPIFFAIVIALAGGAYALRSFNAIRTNSGWVLLGADSAHNPLSDGEP